MFFMFGDLFEEGNTQTNEATQLAKRYGSFIDLSFMVRAFY